MFRALLLCIFAFLFAVIQANDPCLFGQCGPNEICNKETNQCYPSPHPLLPCFAGKYCSDGSSCNIGTGQCVPN